MKKERFGKYGVDTAQKSMMENFVELFAEWFEENLANAGVIADQHFEWGKSI
jgi:hypothetical protein